jgi:hypothetical protein
MPRVLIAISSCETFERSGLNSPLRETWLPNLSKFGCDYRFFHGSGSSQKNDVVILNVVDEMYGLTEKLKAKCRWAVERGYEYMFSAFPDTYTCPEKLIEVINTCPDYLGSVHQFPGSVPFVQGGPGVILSRKSCEILSNDPSSYLNDDCWAADVLSKHRINAVHHPGFTAFGPGPLRNNSSITNHLSTQPCGYTGDNLREEHKRWLES